MSSHREAPGTAADPVADNTDVYAFVSPDNPDMVTLIANFIPFEYPPGGPNFYKFGDDVLYQIFVDNDGDGFADIAYQFQFQTQYQNPNTFLYNTGPIQSLSDPNWNIRQVYTLTKGTIQGGATVLGTGLTCPPCNIGPRSTPNYASLAQAAIHTLPSGETVFAGERAEGFFVDIGSIFDLGDLRPLQNLHLIPTPAASGVNGTQGFNVQSIAVQVPKRLLTHDGNSPTDPLSSLSVIGVWASASRQKSVIYNGNQQGEAVASGPYVQVSRLGNPLFNEVMIPVGQKDLWNSLMPPADSQFAQFVKQPMLAKLLPVLYPKAFPNLAAYTADRADLVAIFLTGLPQGVIPGFQNNTSGTLAEMERLNMAISPSQSPNSLGLLGNDLAGFPNGRRVADDVVTIELRALAGATIPLVNKSYTPDAAVSSVTDGLTPSNSGVSYLSSFPYLGLPYGGYQETPPSGSSS